MFIVLHVPSLSTSATREARAEFIASALAGIVAHNDAGDAIVTALEQVAAQHDVPATERDASMTVACVDALAAHGGNVSRAARALGLARSTVRAHAARWRAWSTGAGNDSGRSERSESAA